jgi:hypothetical protein
VTTDPAALPGPGGLPTSDQPNWAAYSRYSVIAAIAGFALLIVAGIAHVVTAGEAEKHVAQQRFVLSYLCGFIFWFSLPLGGMSLLMIAYLCKTSWGLLLRRPFEAAIQTWPLFLGLLVILIVLACTPGISPYWWTRPEEAKKEEVDLKMMSGDDKRQQAIETGKAMRNRAIDFAIKERNERDKGIFYFLSKPSFVIVSLVLFGIWVGFIYFLNKWGREASDETNTARVDAALEKLKNISGPGIIVYALTITAAATLWVMSLEPGWSSTMFPVIFAVNQFLTCMAFNLAVFLFLVSKPPFRDLMRPKFQLDMGTLMLAFTLFWSYTSFSQFMLVWIGNLPEEIPFFLKRSAGAWWYVSAAMIALHFALPFLLLLFRDIKLHPVRLRTVAIYLCVICAIDVVWWIQPSLPNESNFPFFIMDIGSIVGVGGLFGIFWIWRLKQRPLFPASQAFLLPEGHHVGEH